MPGAPAPSGAPRVPVPPRFFERELEAIATLAERAVDDGAGSVVVVEGEAGVGKSRLGASLTSALADRNIHVLEGRCCDGIHHVATYRPLVELLEAAVVLVDLLDPTLALHGRQAVRALVGGGAPGGEGLGWVERRASLFETVARVLVDVSHHVRLALVVHDLDVADLATQGLVVHLAALAAPTEALASRGSSKALRGALVLTGRTIDVALLPGIATTSVRLSPLDEDGVRAFLNRPEVVAFFAEATGGRPRELEALLERLPVDPDDLLRTRWAHTGHDARRLASTLAVAGRTLGLADLGELAGIDESQLAAAAQALQTARLCRREVVSGELRLSLLGRGDEAAIYALIPDAERVPLHLAVGHWLQIHGRDELLDRVRIAEHLLRGGAGRPAVEAALRAVEALELTYGYDRAVELLRRARAAAVGLGGASGHPLALAPIDERLCELERFVGDYEAALATARRLEAVAPGASARRRIAELHILRDELDLGLAALDEAEQQAASTEHQERVRIAAARAEALYLAGRGAEAKVAAEDALLRDEQVIADGAASAASLLRIEVQNTLGKVALAEARYPDATRIFGENIALARALGSSFEESRALFNLGITELRLGAHGAAQGHYQAALDLSERAGDHRNRAFCLQNLGVLAHWRGDYAEAIARFAAAVSAFRRTGMRTRLAWVALDLASVYLDLHDRDAALATFGLIAQLGDALSPKLVADCALIEARIEALAGRRVQARALALAARDTAAGHQAERAIEAGQLLLRLALDDSDHAAAAKLIETIVPSRSDRVQLRTALLTAELDLVRGNTREARRQLRGVLPVAQRIADLDVEWRAHELLGRAALVVRDENEANRHFRAALAIDLQLREHVPAPQRGAFEQDPQRRALEQALRLPAVVASSVAALPRPTSVPTGVATSVDDNRPLIGRVIGRHPRMRQVCAIVERAASADSIVLLRGESGTGKELIAEALHEGSPRNGRPFIKVNCGAIVESLLLSELFGHERGAFTGALQRKKGRFEIADGGTLFLDEIGDVSPLTQVALLRVLQERRFERVGGTTPVKVDVRIICATNRNLEQMVARGEFREDLYYRLRGIQIELPSLRERASDVPLIARTILANLGAQRGHAPLSLSIEAEALLRRHDWPGNVRELENVLRSASLFAEGGHIAAADLGELLASPRVARELRAVGGDAPSSRDSAWQRLSSEGLSLKELKTRVEIECIERAVSESRGNITKAAELLGMKRPRLSQLIKEHRIRLDVPDGDASADSANMENP
ncbi:MAG: sigma-54 dependent transcriptional regulator [Polyangia bacterium]